MAMGRRATADHPEPPCRLLRFEATDGVALSGLLYEPPRPTKRAAIWLHGSGGASVFESRRTNFLADEFVRRGIAYFPFNNRGAHVVKRLRSRRRDVGGGFIHEVIRDCVKDIDGAVAELRRRGFRELHLLGHSTGANKIAVYDRLRPRNPVRSYVFLAGGDDTGLILEQLGRRRFDAMLERAKKMIAEKRGGELAPAALCPMNTPMSWRSLFDMANPDGDYNVFPFHEALTGERVSRKPLFRHLRGVRKPSLFVWGDRDEFLSGDPSSCVAAVAALDRPNFELALMADADHGFGGREEELGTMIAEWLP